MRLAEADISKEKKRVVATAWFCCDRACSRMGEFIGWAADKVREMIFRVETKRLD